MILRFDSMAIDVYIVKIHCVWTILFGVGWVEVQEIQNLKHFRT